MSRQPLTLPPGLNSDDTPYLRRGVWADASNVRFHGGMPEIDGGYIDALVQPLTGICRNALIWSDRDAIRNIAFATHSNLMVSSGGDLIDITPPGLAAGSIDGAGGPGYGAGPYGGGDYGESIASEWFARTWSLTTFGDHIYANPRNGGIYLYQNDGNAATLLTNAPTKVYGILNTPERQLLAFGCNEEASGNFNGMCIRGSGIDGQHTLWNTTNTVYRPFETILEGGSYIVGREMLGDYVMVWTDTHLHRGQYIGAQDQAYLFVPVGGGCGLAGPNAACVVGQTAIWVSRDYQIWTFTPGVEPKPLACPILKDFRDNVVRSQGEKIVACSINQFSEIRFFYPDQRDGIENSRYISFSLAEGTWSRGKLARTAAADATASDKPLFVGADSHAYWHETGETANGGALTWSLRTSDMYIGEAEQRGLIRGIWPDFKDQRGPVNLTIYCRDTPQGPERVKGPYPLAAGQAKQSFLIDTALASFEFSGASAPAYMRMGKPAIDVVPTGQQR